MRTVILLFLALASCPVPGLQAQGGLKVYISVDMEGVGRWPALRLES